MRFYWRDTPGKTPWAIFWGVFTRFHWGWQVGSRWTGWIVRYHGGDGKRLYWSWDGTPSRRGHAIGWGVDHD